MISVFSEVRKVFSEHSWRFIELIVRAIDHQRHIERFFFQARCACPDSVIRSVMATLTVLVGRTNTSASAATEEEEN